MSIRGHVPEKDGILACVLMLELVALGRKPLAAVRECLAAKSPVFGAIDRIVPAAWGPFGAEGPMDAAPFQSPVANFYMTDPISRCSRIMAECTATRRQRDASARAMGATATGATGTGG